MILLGFAAVPAPYVMLDGQCSKIHTRTHHYNRRSGWDVKGVREPYAGGGEENAQERCTKNHLLHAVREEACRCSRECQEGDYEDNAYDLDQHHYREAGQKQENDHDPVGVQVHH